MIDNSYKWYPVYTKSRAEKKAYQELQKKNITCYLPLRRELRQWSDRKKWVEEPLFKSYVFVHISSKEYPEVLMTQGISRFVYFSSKIASMPQKQIEDLKLLLANGDELEIIEHEIEPGERVLINAGPFKGMIAELVSIKNKRSLVLKLEALGYAIHINTSMAYIEPLA
ncbi:UpxY family transcription antiterminator [Pedobacter montanisoli]|uniref:UpxY family transcription antiterminator n=1 Tax=Pedobacter montanisoli TaxID=2923277 RepID=A0ABS9ZVW4_9SPHI|nr:UpxY family transcription antiterminator [Pedobacter montanisoli]MCJ0742455.1 UpxY family transcription antiterminator [Pedobacter montanisoli]